MTRRPKAGTLMPSQVRLTECVYCEKFTCELDRHGPGRCSPTLDQLLNPSHPDGMDALDPVLAR